MTVHPLCGSCPAPAAWTIGEGPDAWRVCDACKAEAEAAGEAPAFEPIGPAFDVDAAARKATAFARTRAYTRLRDDVGAAERKIREDRTCDTCGARLPAGTLAIGAAGAHFCPRPSPCWADDYAPMDARRAWKLAREIIARTEDPVLIPGWILTRYGMVCPF